MRIHHLNCTSLCPYGGALIDGRSLGLRARLTCHCLLVETSSQLVLVDTGLGLRDVARPRARIHPLLRALLRPRLRAEMTAIRQIERLGFRPRDVQHIVLTHLDFDHAGGLDDFPHATVHLLTMERDAAVARRTLLDRMRYRPDQWHNQASFRGYDAREGDGFFGFECVRQLAGIEPEVLLIPLAGHTLGHAGVAIRGEHEWLLHAGDAYFYRGEMDAARPGCTPGLRLYQRLMEKDRGQRLMNQRKLRALKQVQGDEIRVFCAHDAVEYERLASRPESEPLPSATVPPLRVPIPEPERTFH